MSISRRGFLGQFSQLAIAGIMTSLESASAKNSAMPLISIIQGDAFDGYSQFSILSFSLNEFKFFIYKENTLVKEVFSQKVKNSSYKTRIDKVFVNNLEIDVEYQLRIFENGKLVDCRWFKSYSSQKNNYRVAVLSCMDDRFHQLSMWESLKESDPDLILFIGDSVYADNIIFGPAKPNDLWRRFAETRFCLDIFKWRYLKPILAIWDDHDFGGNDCGKSYPYVKESQNNFKAFYAQDFLTSPNISHGPGISKSFKLGESLLIMMDGRTFRDKKFSLDLSAMFGSEQEYWLFDIIKNHNGPIFIVNGSQWFSDIGGSEAYLHDFPASFYEFMKKLKFLDKKIVFISGDIHFSEIIQIPFETFGYETFEITSSSMHSFNLLGFPRHFNTKNRILSTWERNFTLLDLQSSSQGLMVKSQSYGPSTKVFYEHSFLI